jgi:hypothetical protein
VIAVVVVTIAVVIAYLVSWYDPDQVARDLERDRALHEATQVMADINDRAVLTQKAIEQDILRQVGEALRVDNPPRS